MLPLMREEFHVEPQYTFTPFDHQGRALEPLTAELPNDLAAVRRASEVLNEHPSFSRIFVEQNGRPVFHVPGSGGARAAAAVTAAVEASHAAIGEALRVLQRHQP